MNDAIKTNQNVGTLGTLEKSAIDAAARAAAAMNAAVNAWNDAGWTMETWDDADKAGSRFYLAMKRAEKEARAKAKVRG